MLLCILHMLSRLQNKWIIKMLFAVKVSYLCDKEAETSAWSKLAEEFFSIRSQAQWVTQTTTKQTRAQKWVWESLYKHYKREKILRKYIDRYLRNVSKDIAILLLHINFVDDKLVLLMHQNKIYLQFAIKVNVSWDKY